MDWDHLGKEDLEDNLKGLGHELIFFSLPEEARDISISDEWIEKIKKELDREKIDLIFSVGYFPTVSEAAEEKGCRYISWIYYGWDFNIYAANIINEVNKICVCDLCLYEELKGQGISTIHHVPFAVNTERYKQVRLTAEEQNKYGTTVSYIDCMNGKQDSSFGENPIFEQMMSYFDEKDEYTGGYIEGLLEAQMQLYGCDILPENLTEELMGKIITAKSLPANRYGKYITDKKAYIDDIFGRYMAAKEQTRLLESISEFFETYLYTNDTKRSIGKCVNQGKLDLVRDMPKVVRASKINLCIPQRSIRTGIPYLAMNIMGAGGFLLTYYQAEFFNYFEADVDFAFYTDKDELLDKIQFFAANDADREQIAQNAFDRVAADHTLGKRLEGLLK
jgi:spore maturation protein CgeB